MTRLHYPPPELVARAEGDPLNLFALCRDARITPRVTTSAPPTILLGPGSVFRKVVVPGEPWRAIYGLGADALPADPADRAREILDRLAYQFHDWAGREIVAAERRFRRWESHAWLVSERGWKAPQARAARLVAVAERIPERDLSHTLAIDLRRSGDADGADAVSAAAAGIAAAERAGVIKRSGDPAEVLMTAAGRSVLHACLSDEAFWRARADAVQANGVDANLHVPRP